jgi:hypothetical protein
MSDDIDQTSSDTQKKTIKTSANSVKPLKKNKSLTSLGWISLVVLMVVIVLQLLHLGRHAIALQLTKTPAGIQEPLFKAFKSLDSLL